MKQNTKSSISLSKLFKSIAENESKQGQLYPLGFLFNCAQSAILAGAKIVFRVHSMVSPRKFLKQENTSTIIVRSN